MNKINLNIPNKIKQPSQCCTLCGKTYKKRNNLEKHKLLCEILQNSRFPQKKNIQKEEEEEIIIPNQKQLYEMIVELGLRFQKIENKMEDINKFILKKKKKINVLDWLNTNLKPKYTFDLLLDLINISENHILSLFNNTFYDVLNELFNDNIYLWNEFENPIFALENKTAVFYIYDKDLIWKPFTNDLLIKFLNKIHIKIIKGFYDWKKTKINEIKLDDSLATRCNKVSVKLMSIEFNQEIILNKIKNLIYVKIKKDIKTMIEYELEI